MSPRRLPLPCKRCGGVKVGRARLYCAGCAPAAISETKKQKRRRHDLRLRYGITVDQHDELLSAQKGLCALCDAEPPSGNRVTRLALDHDHVTGVLRGLLCQRCNMALHFLENAEWRERAERYLIVPPALVVLGRCAPVAELAEVAS